MTFTENPSTAASPAPGVTDLIPSVAQARVSVGPSAGWVTVRPLDETVDPAIGGAQVVLMIDRQYRVLGDERYERPKCCDNLRQDNP